MTTSSAGAFRTTGPDYISFDHASAGIDGGFVKGDPGQTHSDSAPLIVLYSQDLKATEDAIVEAGGKIVVATFEFPGGRRFHFSDGAGQRAGGLVGIATRLMK